MTDSVEKKSWNILESPWIEVSSHRGVWRTASPLDALREAAMIRAIGASSPLDEFAIHRFLVTLLYWKAEASGDIAAVRASLLQDRVPAAVLAAIEGERGCFNLFDPKRPFLQDAALAGEPDKPVGSLFAEISTGTNIAHFDHSRDLQSPLCIPCVARGLLRLVPWSQSGGAGLTPSIHGAPPIALIPLGSSLAQTLGLSLVEIDRELGSPTWTGTFHPTSPTKPIPLLEGFTWNPRRVLLPHATEEARCGMCGALGPAITSISFKKNESVKKPEGDGAKLKSFDWRDPAFLYRAERTEPARSGDESNAALYEDLKWLGDAPMPATTASSHGWSVVVPCTNLANNKSYDHRRIELPPGSALHKLRLEHRGAEGLTLADHPVETAKGWRSDGTARTLDAIERFISAATAALDETDWLELRASIGRSMHVSPRAFAIFSAVYWRARNAGRSALRREAAWLLLKLLALAPSRGRAMQCHRGLQELLDAVPTRQGCRARSEEVKGSPYPIAQPKGHALEASLASAIEADLAAGRAIPWIELGMYLNESTR